MREKFVPLAVAGALFVGGCTSGDHQSKPPEAPTTTTTAPNQQPPLKFQAKPGGSMNAGDCNRDTNSWAVYIDSNPADIEDPARDEHTVGLADHYDVQGNPIFAVGATIRALGNFSYEVATTNPEVPNRQVDVRKGALTEFLQTEDGYDAVLSGRLAQDDQVYFEINCLPDFGFNAGQGSVPLGDLPTVPNEAPEPTPPATQSA